MMNKFITIARFYFVAVFVSSVSAQNVTSLNGKQAQEEKYTLEILAPKIDNNVFPVAIKYFDALLTPKKKLTGVLLVPVKLTITHARERRLLVLYATNAEKDIKFGTKLDKISLLNLDANIKKKSQLTTFVGSNKKIFRTLTSGTKHEIFFNLPVTC